MNTPLKVQSWNMYGVILQCRCCSAVVLFANECDMSARNRLGIERATNMIAIFTNTQQQVGDDFFVSLSVIDGDI